MIAARYHRYGFHHCTKKLVILMLRNSYEHSTKLSTSALPAAIDPSMLDLYSTADIGEIEPSNSESSDPRWLQQALNQALGLRLVVDGRIGPQTRSAVRSFQQRQGLMVDGIAGPRTLAALRAAVGIGTPNLPGSSGTMPEPGATPANTGASGHPSTAIGTNLISSAQLPAVILQNQQLGRQIGWWKLYEPISVYHLRFRQRPPEAEFAQAVARWQQAIGMTTVTGILDQRTWRLMRPRAAIAPFTTSPATGAITRPRGLWQVVQAFGDPANNHAAWRRANIVRAYAPAGFIFDTQEGGPRDYVQVHRKLKPHFEALFQAIARAGLWNAIQPVSGPYAFRKKRRGKGLSIHSFGIAIDIQPNLHPPEQIRSYPSLRVVEIFRDYGFHWGIFFKTPDPHHFQFATGT